MKAKILWKVIITAVALMAVSNLLTGCGQKKSELSVAKLALATPVFAAEISCKEIFQDSRDNFSPVIYNEYVSHIDKSEPVVIALGFFFDKKKWDTEALKRFAYSQHLRTQKKVVTWGDFATTGLVDRLGGPDPVEEVETAIKSAIQRSNNESCISVRLDSFDPQEAFSKGPPRREERSAIFGNPKNYTAREIYLILSHPEYFQVTRWFLEGKELTPIETENYFGKYFPDNLR